MVNLPNYLMSILQNVIPISIRTLDTSCYLLYVPFTWYQYLGLFNELIYPRIVPNQKLHYFVDFESYKGLWRLKQNFHITDEEMEGLKE